MNPILSSPTAAAVVRCPVAAHAAVRATPEALAQWRRQPPPVTGPPVPASFVKHSEDQTLAALAAVHAAVVRAGWAGRSFADWGVVVAANFFGRGGTAHTIQRYAQEGAWGVSPHLIPHQSLHAPSGTLSQILKTHGPNFGISGGPQACYDAFLIAAALVAEGTIPGLWLLLVGHDREVLPAENGKPADAPREPGRAAVCEAVALALAPGEDGAGLCLCVGADPARGGLDEFSLTALAGRLADEAGPTAGAWRLPGAGWCALELVALSAGSPG